MKPNAYVYPGDALRLVESFSEDMMCAINLGLDETAGYWARWAFHWARYTELVASDNGGRER